MKISGEFKTKHRIPKIYKMKKTQKKDLLMNILPQLKNLLKNTFIASLSK